MSAEADYTFYLSRLRDAASKYSCAVRAYVLMTNHVHLLMASEKSKGVSLMMQALGRGMCDMSMASTVAQELSGKVALSLASLKASVIT